MKIENNHVMKNSIRLEVAYNKCTISKNSSYKLTKFEAIQPKFLFLLKKGLFYPWSLVLDKFQGFKYKLLIIAFNCIYVIACYMLRILIYEIERLNGKNVATLGLW